MSVASSPVRPSASRAEAIAGGRGAARPRAGPRCATRGASPARRRCRRDAFSAAPAGTLAHRALLPNAESARDGELQRRRPSRARRISQRAARGAARDRRFRRGSDPRRTPRRAAPDRCPPRKRHIEYPTSENTARGSVPRRRAHAMAPAIQCRTLSRASQDRLGSCVAAHAKSSRPLHVRGSWRASRDRAELAPHPSRRMGGSSAHAAPRDGAPMARRDRAGHRSWTEVSRQGTRSWRRTVCATDRESIHQTRRERGSHRPQRGSGAMTPLSASSD